MSKLGKTGVNSHLRSGPRDRHSHQDCRCRFLRTDMDKHLYLHWPLKEEVFSQRCTEHWQAADYKEMETFSIILDVTVNINKKCQ